MHDHFRSLKYSFYVREEKGNWTKLVDKADVKTGADRKVCRDNKIGSRRHPPGTEDPVNCFKDYSVSIGREIDSARIELTGSNNHLHIKNITWVFPSKPTPTPTPVSGEKFVVGVGDVYGKKDRMFIVSISDPTTIQQARDCYTYGPQHPRCGKFIFGSIASGDGGFNTNWSWHLKPETVRMVEVAMELCDGVPSDVEREGVNFDAGTFCPFGSYILALGSQYPTISPTPTKAPTPTKTPTPTPTPEVSI